MIWLRRTKLLRKMPLLLIVGMLLQRMVFILLGWFDIETEPAIIQGLKHPYQVVWQAPYGVLWYAINIPLTWARIPFISEAQSWLFWTSLIDSFVIWYLFHKTFSLPLMHSRIVAPAYVIISVLTWRQAPYNLVVVWLTALGLSFWGFLILAVITKLPVGAPPEVWEFALHGTTVPTNWRYYGLLIFFWLLIVYHLLISGKEHLKTWFNKLFHRRSQRTSAPPADTPKPMEEIVTGARPCLSNRTFVEAFVHRSGRICNTPEQVTGGT